MESNPIVVDSNPASIALTAYPAAIAFDGTATATVTARVTDAARKDVADGTPVSFRVAEAAGRANPTVVGTSFGEASSTITPAAAADSLTVEVSCGTARAAIRIDRLGTIADLFKKSAWRVFGDLLEPPFVPHQQKEIARSLKVPEASVQRGLRTLIDAGLVQRKRSQYVVSVGQEAVRYFWLLRQAERQSALPPALANALSVLFQREFSRDDDCVIVFGSWARGVAVLGESDVDVAVFTTQSDRVGSRRFFEGSFRIETQTWDVAELRQPRTSAALDALLNGIALTRRDDVYDALLGLRSFPKSFLLYRLEQADHMLFRGELSTGDAEAEVFFASIAQRIVGQVRNILEHGRTMSWRETPREEPLRQAIAKLGERLAREGDEIWLT